MTKEEFTEIYSGNAMVITDPNATTQELGNSTQATGTSEQLNNETNQTSGNTTSSESVNNETDTNSANVQSENTKTLTTEEMQKIQGKGLRWSYRWRGWYPVRVRAYYGFNMARCLWGWDIDGFKNYGYRYMNWYRRVGYRYAARRN
ncbi:MAG: hypothetical protein BME94_00875 [Methanobacteriales archaeon Met13]